MSDIAEFDIPDLGLLKVHDPETDEAFWIDTSSKKERLLFKKEQEEKWIKFNKECSRIKFDLIQISTNGDYVDPLKNYFKGREKRI